MVSTGGRATALSRLLGHIGLEVVAVRPAPPRLMDFGLTRQAELLRLYAELGGAVRQPKLRPGAWDLALADGRVVELDEELHFNRYRTLTLQQPWSADLPWRDAYLQHCVRHELECLRAGTWGKRWTNASCEALFGSAGTPGDLEAGSPRWKQRALYDAMKDAQAAQGGGPPLVRVSVYDPLGDHALGDALENAASADADALARLVEVRTCWGTVRSVG